MPERLRFCMVTTFYPPFHFGGDAIFVYRLAQALAAEGHEVDVVHSLDAYRLRRPSPAGGAFPDHPRVRRVPLESASPRVATLLAHQLGRPALYAERLAEVFGRGHDVIHFHNVSLMGAPDVLRLGRALKLYTTHEYWLCCPTHVLFAFGRAACTEKHCLPCTLAQGRLPQPWRAGPRLARALAHVDLVLAPSRFAWERHRAEGLARPMEILPHFVPEPVASPRDCDHAPPPVPERPFFLYAGRLEKLKGVQDLIALFARERRADLLIAGEGSYRPTLERLARGLPHVRFLGPLTSEALSPLYARARALLAPSLCYETFGLSAVEAMSHGTPVIVRRIGALEEVVSETGAGFTFASLDEAGAAVGRLLAEPALGEALGERGRAAARARYSLEVHLDRYLDLVRRYRGAAAAPTASPALAEVGA